MKTLVQSYRAKLMALCFVLAALFLGVCSKSSPFYPINDWVDVHCFFTVGRSILDGLVPYRDLYEQKGPVLYFLYAIAAIISDKSFLGVFFLEVVTFGLFLYFCGQIARLYLGKSRAVYGICAVLAAVIPVSGAFAHGGGAEQLCLFMLAYSLMSVLQALKENRCLTVLEGVLNGVFAACVLYVKFTMLGFYLGLALFVIIWYLSVRQSARLLSTIASFLLGVAGVSVIVLGYFAIHGAVGDFFTVYFYNNLFLYPMETEASKLELIQNCLKSTLQYNTSYSWFLTIGIVLFLLEIRTNWRGFLMAILTFGGLTVGTYWGGRGYTYYGLILSVYTVFGLIVLVRACQIAGAPKLPRWLSHWGVTLAGMVLVVTMLLNYSYKTSTNTYLMDFEKEDHPAYRFAETINTVENPTLLNFGFLDGGFYYAADVTPSCEFFCTLNINAPDMWYRQYDCINNREVDFVITRQYPLTNYYVDPSGYELVDETTFYFEGWDFTYYLYQKK